jgi:tetratricopeptide (TPR) repeat protein
MPFGRKKSSSGEEINFDLVYEVLIAPALRAADVEPVRADAELRAGSIHADMFQDLLLADVVVADLTIDNPNVFYELGVRHALRDNATVSIFTGRERAPFDIVGERAVIYAAIGEPIDEAAVARDRARLTEVINTTLRAWRGRKASPVYRYLPNLEEPQWKRLKVGDVNEFWQKLEDWRSLVSTAKAKQRAGDILLLADETPNRILELEALKAAANALMALGSVKYALTILDRGLSLDPADRWFLQQRGLALGRTGRFAEARTLFAGLADTYRDGETLGLLARTNKDHWLQLWRSADADPALALQRAKAAAPALERAVDSYTKAFQAEPWNCYPGINALTLGHLWQYLTGRQSASDLGMIAQGVRWAVHCAMRKRETEGSGDFWERATRAEIRLVADGDPGCLDDYEAATAGAVAERYAFALDSIKQQIDILFDLGFRRELVEPAQGIVERAREQMVGLLGPRRGTPKNVVLFSGHMIDNPNERGDAKPLPARFPSAKADAVGRAIDGALAALKVEAGDLALCGGACGGDLLFAEACLARGMHLEIRLARHVPEFLGESVTFADADGRWFRLFQRVTADPRCSTLIMPEEIGPAPAGASVHDRNNLWQLYAALSGGLDHLQFIALWDGKVGRGPGGTEEMITRIRALTGRTPMLIDPATL